MSPAEAAAAANALLMAPRLGRVRSRCEDTATHVDGSTPCKNEVLYFFSRPSTWLTRRAEHAERLE